MARLVADPFWESAYRDDAASTFGPPSPEVVALAERLPRGSRVLDVGCGEGRNAICLARAGHAVDAIDVSAAGIAKLARVAAGLDVRARVADLATYAFAGPWDLIVCHGVLHLLVRDTWARAIERMQGATAPGGANVVAVFTDRLPVPPDLAPFMGDLFRENELCAAYAGWDVESAESYVLADEHPGGIRHRHAIDKVVAWRR